MKTAVWIDTLGTRLMQEEAEQKAKEARVQSDEEWKKAVAEEKERLRQQRKPADAAAEPIPEADIRIFLAGLYTQTLVCLGEVANPATGEAEQSLPEAQYLIDTITMLKEKTKGNLTAEEAAYIDGVLYDLRMRFVSAAAEPGAPGVSEKATGKA